ncbi:dephospho-CoA kinase [bacterium]|nr:dephospho-CoA kinase [bacterium]
MRVKSMVVVGLTGGIASGKSTLMGVFRSAGVPGVDIDRIVHRLLRKGTRVYAAVRALFGGEYLTPSGQIDRRRLGRKIFSDRSARRCLERIVHPAVFAEMDRRIGRYARRGARLVVVDIPLLYETRSARRFDKIVVAYAPRRVQMARLLRRGLGRAESAARIRAQWSLAWKRRRADVVFDMQRPLSKIRQEVERWVQSLRRPNRA